MFLVLLELLLEMAYCNFPLRLDMAFVGSCIVSENFQGAVQNYWRDHNMLQFLHDFINRKFLEGCKAEFSLHFILVKYLIVPEYFAIIPKK